MVIAVKYFLSTLFLVLAFSLQKPAFSQNHPPRYMENLDRGVVAVNQGDGNVFIGWRLLGTDPENLTFDIYRSTDNGKQIKLNKKPLNGSTNFIDNSADLTKTNTWYVTPTRKLKGAIGENKFTLNANSPVRQYISIPLKTPEGYAAADASVGDLDGDGQYEIVLHMWGRGFDNSHEGISTEPIIQAYKLDGTFMWEINLGKNIREGAHYTQMMVYDLDSDGKAEFACKTADGTIDGKGNVIGDSTKDWRNRAGRILDGPEFFTIFNGETGEAMKTVDYVPQRGDVSAWGGEGGNRGSDSYGNRVDRFLACIAYLDGERPSVVMTRGYYGRSVLAAWDWRNGELTQRWVFDSENRENPFSGQGNHNLSVADIDNDGKDEIIFGSMVIDNDGSPYYTTGFRHGDAMHVSDLDLSSPGLEVFTIHELEKEGEIGPGASLYSPGLKKVLWSGAHGRDVGGGVAEDIDPDNPGAEMWFHRDIGLLNMKGERIGDMPSSANFVVWWDGGLTRQLQSGTRVSKYKGDVIFNAEDAATGVGSKGNPNIQADIFGDWREELIFRSKDNSELRIYTTTIPTEHRMYTLMHDPVYRLGVAWQNVTYNQPPHLGFWLGAGTDKAPKPTIKYPSGFRR